MTEIVWLACVLIVCAHGLYGYLQWLAAFKRRNDLQDKFQGFERAQNMTIDALRIDVKRNFETFQDCNTAHVKNVLDLRDAVADLQSKHANLLPNHEKLVARVTALDEYTKAEISKLGHNVLDQVAEMKTQQAASFQQAQIASRISPRVFKP